MSGCASCGVEALPNSRFCPGCGLPLQPDSFATRTVAAPTVPTPSPATSGTQIPSLGQDSSDGRFLPGAKILDRYRIVSLLGKGGMGEVYRADDLTLNQPVALKFLSPALAATPDALQRFRNEVRLARQVSHPNVCRVHDVGEVDGRLFLSMEYVDGEDLASLLRRIGRLPEDKALEIARKLCAGLAAAHDRGVLHRDLKPANVMLDARGHVLLTDFGLAGIASEIAGAEVRSGTPAYMAPEQLAGKEVSVRSDIYSLGLVLYELFTGKRPFDGNSLADLIEARLVTTPASLSSLVRDLDPRVERVVLRCLQPDPAERPSSALAVSGALPGGDPLAAALAAGETPSPQLVAAAGEGAGLSLRVAIPLYAAIMIAFGAHAFLSHRSSGLEHLRHGYSPEVLRHKAAELIPRFGHTGPVVDYATGAYWDWPLIDHILNSPKTPPWREVFKATPEVLRFWYRQSSDALVALMYHDDLLTPGMVMTDDPPPVVSGMTQVELDSNGRLLQFRTVAPEHAPGPASEAAADWKPLFDAAGLDQAKLQPATPEWTWIEGPDAKFAWTGVWPGTDRPLRVEAGSWRGKPIVFAAMGPWSKTSRMPNHSPGSDLRFVILMLILIGVMFGSVVLARRNLAKGRGDRTGAARLAAFIFVVQMALWVARTHFAPSLGTLAMFLLALCTATFYAAVIWSLYVALEPYVRKRWPQTIISWARMLTGRIRDPIIGRDILIGAALSLSWRLLAQATYSKPQLVSPETFLSFRSAIGECLEVVPHAIRGTLIYFFLLFLFRVLLRNQWLGAALFVAIFTLAGYSGPNWVDLASLIAVYASVALVVMRFGLVALTFAIIVDGVLTEIPFTLDTSTWYFATALIMVTGFVLMVTWAFKTSLGGQKLLREDLFG